MVLPNRVSSIWLIFISMIEEIVWWTLTQTASKILNGFCFVDFFRKALNFDIIKNWRSSTAITQERFNILCWNFVQLFIVTNASHDKKISRVGRVLCFSVDMIRNKKNANFSCLCDPISSDWWMMNFWSHFNWKRLVVPPFYNNFSLLSQSVPLWKSCQSPGLGQISDFGL